MLKMLGREEVDGVIEERGHVEMHCEFCNQRYEFDPVDVAQLFVAKELSQGVTPAALNSGIDGLIFTGFFAPIGRCRVHDGRQDRRRPACRSARVFWHRI